MVLSEDDRKLKSMKDDSAEAKVLHEFSLKWLERVRLENNEVVCEPKTNLKKTVSTFRLKAKTYDEAEKWYLTLRKVLEEEKKRDDAPAHSFDDETRMTAIKNMRPPAPINVDTNSTDVENMYTTGYLSTLVYETEPVVRGCLAALGWALVRFVEIENHVAMVCTHDGIIIVAVRGTDDAADWLTNLNGQLVPLDPANSERRGRVHAGFSGALDLLYADLLDAVLAERKKGDEPAPLVVTGHSLGGAVASLFVEKIAREAGIATKLLYTFGSPRVGDRDFAEQFKCDHGDITYRIVNNLDLVPHTPPPVTYSHVGNHCIYFDSDGDLHHNPATWRQLMDRFDLTPADSDLGFKLMRSDERLLDHLIEKGYLVVIEEAKKKFLEAANNNG